MTKDEKEQVAFAVVYALQKIQDIEQGPMNLYDKRKRIENQLVLMCLDLVPTLPRALQAQVQTCIHIYNGVVHAIEEDIEEHVAALRAQKEARSESLATANEL